MAARARDHKSTYERRNERARSLGYKSYADQRKARQTGVGLRPGDKPGRKRVDQAPDGRRIISATKNTKGFGFIEAQAAKLPPEAEVMIGFDVVTSGATGRTMSIFGSVTAGQLAQGVLGALSAILTEAYPPGTWKVHNTGSSTTPGRVLNIDVTLPSGEELASMSAAEVEAESHDLGSTEPRRSYNPDGTDDF